jgi:hypothetical protein
MSRRGGSGRPLHEYSLGGCVYIGTGLCSRSLRALPLPIRHPMARRAARGVSGEPSARPSAGRPPVAAMACVYAAVRAGVV